MGTSDGFERRKGYEDVGQANVLVLVGVKIVYIVINLKLNKITPITRLF